MRYLMHGIVAALFGLSSAVALAQTAAPRDPNMPDPKNVPPEKIKPEEPSGATGTTGSNLSEKLERSDGVIKPPSNIDPEITAKPPVPNPGTTRVIPPPGSPGGNPNIEPK